MRLLRWKHALSPAPLPQAGEGSKAPLVNKLLRTCLVALEEGHPLGRWPETTTLVKAQRSQQMARLPC
jgi:hypothetical protein